jgi:uncharacterized membrane protein
MLRPKCFYYHDLPLAVLYNGSTLSTVGSPSGRSFANGINDSGQLAGTYGTDASPKNGQAFTYSGGAFRSIGPADSGANAINNAGQVAGGAANRRQ